MTKSEELKEYLKDKNNIEVMFRSLWVRNGVQHNELFGFCIWKDGELNSLDGDDYTLDGVIEYEIHDGFVCVFQGAAFI